jgi:hypothetical protein
MILCHVHLLSPSPPSHSPVLTIYVLLLVGAGFIRVPHPRLYNLPPSQIIKGDPEEAELYSLSVTHQLHCLAVLRHVIIKYEKHDKSRFAGGGHEYHCLDYSSSPNPLFLSSLYLIDNGDVDFVGMDSKTIPPLRQRHNPRFRRRYSEGCEWDRTTCRFYGGEFNSYVQGLGEYCAVCG